MLHTINKSPYEKNSLQTCLRVAPDKSDILLIEDGVYAALKNTDFDLRPLVFDDWIKIDS